VSRHGKSFRRAGSWLNASIIGIQFPVCIGIGYLWGKWLDDWLGTYPWLTGIFSLCGIAAGFLNLFRIAARTAQLEDEEARKAAETEGGDDGGNTPPS
jgi:ATP synthase protein I